MKTAVAERWGIEVIFHKNSSHTDLAVRLIQYLTSSDVIRSVTIHPYTTIDGEMWVLSDHPLSPMVLGDIYADEWVEQTLIMTPEIKTAIAAVITKLAKRLDYIDGIAKDIQKYLVHRPASLNGIMRAMCQDLKWPPIEWTVEDFKSAMTAYLSGKLTTDRFNKFTNYVGHEVDIVSRVVSTAFAIG